MEYPLFPGALFPGRAGRAGAGLLVAAGGGRRAEKADQRKDEGLPQLHVKYPQSARDAFGRRGPDRFPVGRKTIAS